MDKKENRPLPPFFASATPAQEITLILLLAVYYCVYTYFYRIPDEQTIGYWDYHIYTEAFDAILNGKVFFRDFWWWYGPLNAYIQAIFYVLFGRNHFALLMTYYEVIPALGILLSYFYIRPLIKSPFLRVFFVLACFFQNVNCDISSLRHLFAEIIIASFIFSLSRPERKSYFILTGWLTGNSLLIGTEYGVLALLVISATFIFCLLCKGKNVSPLQLLAFVSGVILGLGPFVAYMIYQGTLFDFLWGYYSTMTGNLASNNPGRGSLFPVFPKILLASPRFFIESIYNALVSREFRFYLPLISYCAALILFLVRFIKERNASSLRYFVIPAYGALIYYRVLVGSAYGYMTYGLIPSMTLGFFLLEFIQNRALYYFKQRHRGIECGYFLRYGLLFASIAVWVFLTIDNAAGIFSFDRKPNPPHGREGVYYDKAGMIISKKAYDQYTQINNYIEQHTAPNEYLLTYPWGYYNHFTGRLDPWTSHAIPTSFDTLETRRDRIEATKPRFIVVNLYNNLGMIVLGTVRDGIPTQVSWRTEEGLVFAGNGTLLDIYILENYHIVKKFEYAVILERNINKKPFVRKFRETAIVPPSPDQSDVKRVNISGGEIINGEKSIKIDSRKLRLEYTLGKPLPATHLQIKYRLTPPLFRKFFTAGIMRFGVVDSEGSRQFANSFNDLTDIGGIKPELWGIYLPLPENIKDVNSVWIEYETPEPYFLARELEIIDLKLLLDDAVLNPT